MLESARKLLEIFATRLGLARIFLENELLENARLGFYFHCSKSAIRAFSSNFEQFSRISARKCPARIL